MPSSRLSGSWALSAVALLAALAAGCGATSGSSSESGAQISPGEAAASTAGASAAKSGAATLRLVRVASGLTSPTYATAPRSEPGNLYVVEQPGRIRVIENGKLRSAPFLDITSLVKSGGEQGLLSVAFHPDYATNGRFYVDYTNLDGDTRVVEYRRRASGPPVRVRELLAVDQPYANHNGGQLEFGPDGLLYVGMGDGGAGGDPENRAQNLSSRLGKLLRIDVDKQGADWQMVGYGLRNPWRFSFDRANGNLYIGDVGQNAWEEIDFVRRSDTGLKNYGWDVFEGNHQFEDKQPNGAGTLVRPIYEYPTGEAGTCSVIGGYVYRGKKLAGVQGRYFFGDYCAGTIWSFVERGGKATQVKRYPFAVAELTSFGENARGELFLVSQGGSVYRLAGG